MKTKFMIILLLLIFTIGTVSAIEYTSLKTPDNFKDFDTFGVSEKETDNRVKLTVVPVEDDTIKYMTGNGQESQDHIFKYVDFGYSALDHKFGYEGYTEVVELDGEQFVVSVLFDSKMSPSEEKEFLTALTDFNKLNKVEPVALE
jgi:hypothetical protein